MLELFFIFCDYCCLIVHDVISKFTIHSMSQSSKFTRINLSEFNPPSDPGIQKQVCEYHPNDLQVVNT
jgi:hypothetical protein